MVDSLCDWQTQRSHIQCTSDVAAASCSSTMRARERGMACARHTYYITEWASVRVRAAHRIYTIECVPGSAYFLLGPFGGHVHMRVLLARK